MTHKEDVYESLYKLLMKSRVMKFWAWVMTLWNSNNKYMRPMLKALRLLFVIVLLVLINKCSHVLENSKGQQKSGKSPPLVTLVAARTRDVPVYLTALGSVTPTKGITIKTQVNGQLARVMFQEGQMVKEKDLIAEIDDRSYKALVMQYEGQLARDKALLANAKTDLKRYQTLFRQKAVAKQVLDTQASLVKQYEGTVRSDQGLVEAARVNLAYCRIRTPITGQVGLRLIDPGNFVQITDPSGIVVINAINPIAVVFSLPEDSLGSIINQVRAGAKLRVEAYDRWQNKILAIGALIAIDNQIDLTTGTVKLKAEFQNDNHRLFPNQFVNIRLLVETLEKATVVPTTAIQHGTNGSFVYVADKNLTVKMISLNLGPVVEDETVVTKGITAGEKVVIEGTDRLTHGATVVVSQVSTDNPMQSPSS